MKKYLNIFIQSENQIGIIEVPLTQKEFSIKNKKLNNTLIHIVEPKLVEALQSHFDSPVKIRLTQVLEHTPLTIKVDLILEAEEEDTEVEVFLEETWVY
jgi:hypothetical protein